MNKNKHYIISLIFLMIGFSFKGRPNMIKSEIDTINVESPQKTNEKVLITDNIKEYELKDEYKRFDDKGNDQNNNRLELNRYGNTIRIINDLSYDDNTGGYGIVIEINDSLEIKKVEYKQWVLKFTYGIETSYKIKSISLRINKNPFDTNKYIRGEYELYIEKFIDGKFVNKFEYKAKFKLFNEIKIFNKCWLTMEYTTISKVDNGIYSIIPLDKKAVLLSDPCTLLEKIKSIKREYKYENKKIALAFIISKNGLIESDSFRFSESYPEGLKIKVMKLFTNETKWLPAEANNKVIRASGTYVFN